MKFKLNFPPAARNILFTILLLIPYILYIAFIIQADQGPVDYETFMEIGSRIPSGKAVFTDGNFYPAPYVLLFTLVSFLPRPISMALWLGLPVLIAWLISGKRAWVFIFAPLTAH